MSQKKAVNKRSVSDASGNTGSSKAVASGKKAKADEPLSAADKDLLVELEKSIGTGLASFAEVGNALKKINEGRLYRAKFATFEEYCSQKWGLGRQHCYRLIEAAKCYETIKGEVSGKTPLPKNESQLRPIVGHLKPEDWASAWKQAVDSDEGDKTTAKVVQGVVIGMLGKSSPSKPKVQRPKGSNIAKELAKIADQVEKLLKLKAGLTDGIKTRLESILRKVEGLQQRSSI